MKFSSFQKFIQYVPELLASKKTQDNPDLLQNILVVEAFFILSAMAGLFLYHRLVKRKNRKTLEIRQIIRKRLVYYVKKKKRPDFKFITDNGWNKLPLILPVVESLDTKFKMDVQWLFVMDELLEQVLFPLAREYAMSPWWNRRNWALRCLTLSPRKKDETYFLNFLCDPSTHNRFGAIRPLLKVGSAYSLNVIVEVMEDENRHTQAVFLAMTKFGGDNFYEAIRERLKRELDPAAKRVCIDILSDSLEHSDLFLIKKSLFDHDKSLRLTALRCLGKFKLHHSTQLLISFLSDDMWEVRSLAAKFLGSRKAYQAIPLLVTNACDRNWWVRLNSIQALFDMGDSGRLALTTITKEKDKYAYEMLQYVKALREDKGEGELAKTGTEDFTLPEEGKSTQLELLSNDSDEKKSA